jgi:L-fuconolactonase
MESVIDAHQHFWRFNPTEFAWIDETMSAIAKDFLPDDLRPVARAAGVDGVVSMQSRQTIDETLWLLDLAAEDELIRGVVGWMPLESAELGKELEKVAHRRKLRGVRHVPADDADDQYFLRDDFASGISLLRKFNLCYDLLIMERQLPAAMRFVDRHPSQPFIVDHIAKPKIKSAEMEPWAINLRELAKRSNVWCKLSGMVTEADWRAWTPAALRPYFDVAIEAFGPRLMIGSDWPICLLACPYQRWIETVRQWASTLSETEQRDLYRNAATKAYGL